MIIYPTSLFAVTCLLLLWAIDSYLFLALLRGISQACSGVGLTWRWVQSLPALTDPLHDLVRRWLSSTKWQRAPRWVSWAGVVCGLLLARGILAWLVPRAA